VDASFLLSLISLIFSWQDEVVRTIEFLVHISDSKTITGDVSTVLLTNTGDA